MARIGISCGSLDGANGFQTRAGLRAFQARERIAITGAFDALTRERLWLREPPTVQWIVSTNDLARLHPLSPTWLGKSKQGSLEFETLLELAAERSWAHPGLVRALNLGVTWSNITAGTILTMPRVVAPPARTKAAFLQIELAARVLRAYDTDTNLIAHYPCSIAQRVEKRPVGELRVVKAAENPNYRFDPAVFPESAEARRLGRPLILPPGPNNPVGVAWIGLSMPGYGIHGTPRPEDVGRTESHGCFRLANWNIRQLLKLVWAGQPVYIVP